MSRFQSDVCFIGHCEEPYCRHLMAATEVTKSVSIWGLWGRYMKTFPELRSHWRGEGLWNYDYATALASAKISLGLLSKLIPEQITTRSFEIPASGSMLLAERTDEHQAAFVEGEEAEFFSSADEMKEKLRFYLRDEPARLKIAQKGHERCLKSGYDYRSRMKEVVDELCGEANYFKAAPAMAKS